MDTTDKKTSKAFFDEVNKIDYKQCSSFLFRLHPYEYSSLAYLLGILIAANMTPAEQNSFGNWLQLVGQTLDTISAQYELFDTSNVSTDDFEAFKKDIAQQFDSLLKKR